MSNRGFNPGRGGRGGGGDRGGRGGGRGGDRGGYGRGGGRGGFGRGGPPGETIFGRPAPIDSRLEGNAQEQLINAFKALQVDPRRPLRPGFGTRGTPITVRANFFPVRLPKNPIYDYEVEIHPTTDIKRLKKRIFELLEQCPQGQQFIRHIAHDKSRRLVSAKRLPQPLSIPITFVEDGEPGPRQNAKVYTVSIKFARELNPNELIQYTHGQPDWRGYDPLPLISALNLILQQHAARNGVSIAQDDREEGEQKKKRNTNKYFFPTSSESFDLSPILTAFRGYYVSLRPTFKQPMVNINVCMTGFVKPGNLAEALRRFEGMSGALPTLPPGIIKSMHVVTRHLGYRRHRLKAIGTKTARNQDFPCDEFGGRISVENYFKRKYNITLRHPADLPVVNIGTKDKAVWVPAELCEILPGSIYRGKLSDQETAQMIRYACNIPIVNAQHITNEGFAKLGLLPATTPSTEFGVSVSNEMAVIPARELNPPRLNYRVGQPRVANGAWNILDVKFHRGANVPSWWVFVVRDGNTLVSGPQDEQLQTLVRKFYEKMTKSGMTLPPGKPKLLVTPALPPVFQDPGRKQALTLIKKALQEEIGKTGAKPGFVLVLLSKRDNYIYPGIKRIGDVELGIHTIHMQLSKALGDERKQDQYLSNVALKVNTKCGGINHRLDTSAMDWLRKKSTMMVGIDVTHRGPGSREGTPSIAAVVASVDDDFVQFPASMRIQQSDEVKEMLDELKDMLVERLAFYEKKNKKLPDRLFIFRDGVSEGQFDVVLREELPQIEAACKKFNTAARKSYRPQISIIICGKRHHSKLFPTDSQYADRNGNTRPGTVVDRGITGVFDFDFYLQAHAGIQGHVKATHYTVIYDETRFSADEIQQGTNDVSYLYARATRAVSLMPPAYYADLACERGRCYLNEFLSDDTASVTSRSSGGRADRAAERRRVFEAAKKAWGNGIHPDIGGSMFYI
ncbi:hypothetical protein VKT23_018916 [Stygiomarasmius scandens]|uniref:Argonaute-like protein n=1 Tax=Marasmiellus scandens TaxID=2682957 RepID=A0ABR1IQ85_9AGAR